MKKSQVIVKGSFYLNPYIDNVANSARNFREKAFFQIEITISLLGSLTLSTWWNKIVEKVQILESDDYFRLRNEEVYLLPHQKQRNHLDGGLNPQIMELSSKW